MLHIYFALYYDAFLLRCFRYASCASYAQILILMLSLSFALRVACCLWREPRSESYFRSFDIYFMLPRVDADDFHADFLLLRISLMPDAAGAFSRRPPMPVRAAIAEAPLIFFDKMFLLSADALSSGHF